MYGFIFSNSPGIYLTACLRRSPFSAAEFYVLLDQLEFGRSLKSYAFKCKLYNVTERKTQEFAYKATSVAPQADRSGTKSCPWRCLALFRLRSCREVRI